MQLAAPAREVYPAGHVQQPLELAHEVLPAAHIEQTDAPASLKLPALQGVHATDPEPEKVPAKHNPHAVALAEEYRPLGHSPHSSDPADGAALPAAHTEQPFSIAPVTIDPAGHSFMQRRSPLNDTKPAAHSRHTPSLDAPITVEYRPAAQAVQFALPPEASL